MRVDIRSLLIPAAVGAIVALALIAYAGAGSVTAAPASHAAKAHKLARAKKLRKALHACAKERKKSMRRSCDAKARRRYGPPVRSTPREEAPPPDDGTEVPETPAREVPAMETQSAAEKAKIASELERAHSASGTPNAQLVARGQTLFASSCASCHGMNGREGTNLAEVCGCNEPIYPLAQSVGGVMQELIEPIRGSMPDMDKDFTIEEKEALGAYVCVDVTNKCPAPPA